MAVRKRQAQAIGIGFDRLIRGRAGFGLGEQHFEYASRMNLQSKISRRRLSPNHRTLHRARAKKSNRQRFFARLADPMRPQYAEGVGMPRLGVSLRAA